MTIAELRELFLRAVRALLPQADTSSASPLAQYGATIAAVNAGVYQRLERIWRDSVPSTATLDGARVWGKALRIPRKGPTQARGKVALLIQGEPGADIADGLELRAQSNQIAVLVSGHYVIEPSGQVRADAVTLDRGERTNLPAGTVLRFVSPPIGVEESAKLIKSLRGGLDDEPGGTYQARVARRLAEPPQGGNEGDYRRWVEEALPDVVLTGYPLARRSGRGSVDVVGLRDASGADRMLTTAERDTVAAYIAPRKLATDHVRVIETVPLIVDVEVAIRPVSEPRFQFDFDDSGGLTIAEWDAEARQITVDGLLPPGIAPSKRLSIQALGSTGQEYLIAAITGPSSLTLVPDPDNPFPPQLDADDKVHAGGPLVAKARRAILDGYTIACSEDSSFVPGINQLGPANPQTRYGSWLDRIEPGRIAAAARAQAGVDDAVCIAPAATVAPIDPAADGLPPPGATRTTGVLIAGRVLVRQMT